MVVIKKEIMLPLIKTPGQKTSHRCTDSCWVQLNSDGQLAARHSTRSWCISGSRGRRSSLTTWPAPTQAWRRAIAPLWSRWSPWWGEERGRGWGRGGGEEEEERIRWRAGRKHRPRSASRSGAIHPWNIPLAHMDNVDRSANNGPPGTHELKKKTYRSLLFLISATGGQ